MAKTSTNFPQNQRRINLTLTIGQMTSEPNPPAPSAEPPNCREAVQEHELPRGVVLEDRPCPLGCRYDDLTFMTGLHDRLHQLPGKFKIVRCKQCGLMRTNPRPTPETIGYYYPDDYGPYHATSTSVTSLGVKRNFLQRIVRRYFDEKHTHIPDMPVGRVLEVGCASGQFLAELRARGWDAYGVEYNSEAAMRAREAGFPVHIGQIEQAPTPSLPYDLVIGWMVLEHLHEPVAALRKLHTWTRPGAMLAISVPDCGALERRLFGKYWYALQVPTHLFHFDRVTLAKVLDQAGWTMESAYNQRELWPVRHSIIHLTDDPNAVSAFERRILRWLNKLLVPGWIWRPLASVLARFGQTGCMTVVARRSAD